MSYLYVYVYTIDELIGWLIDGWIPSVDHGTYGDGGLAQKPWMLNVKHCKTLGWVDVQLFG